MPRIDCFDIIKNNPELVSEFISITEDMPEVEQRKQAIQIVNKLLEASNESLNKVKRKVGQKPQKYNSGVSQEAIDEIIKKYSQPEQKETPQEGSVVGGEVMPKEISDLYSEAASLRFTLNALKQQMGGKTLVGKAKTEYENTKTRLDNIELKLSEYEQSKSQDKPKAEELKKEKAVETKQIFEAGEEANYYDDLFDKTDKVKILYKTGDGENGTERYQVQFENGQEASIWSDKLQPLKATPKAKPEVTEQQIDQAAKKTGITPKNLRDLYKINRELFGLDRIKSLAAAIAMDRMVGLMAKRAGITKAEMYGKLEFRKDTEQNVLKADNALFQGMVDGKPVTLRNMDVDVVNGFYSPIEKNLKEYGKDKIKAKDWLNVVGKGDEAVFTGVRAFLEGKDPNAMVTKQEILDYMKDNRISVVEVVKETKLTKEDAEKEGFKIEQRGDSWVAIAPNDSYDFLEMENATLNALLSSLSEWGIEGRTSDTKFSPYQLEGEKENYKEVLVTLPKKLSIPDGNYIVYADKGLTEKREYLKGFDTEKEAFDWIKQNEDKYPYTIDFEKRSTIINIESDDAFKSSHFDEPNILVHLRMNTRTDADGNKVLFLEEIQSDWGQTGKKEGFKSAEKDAELKRLQEEASIATFDFNQIEEELDRQYEEKKRDGESRSELRKRDSDFNKLAQQYIPAEQRMLEARRAFDLFQVENRSEVPTAPFVMDTNAWTKLGLKVALKEAVAQGVDKIAWTTGTQQFDRWGTEKIDWVSKGKRTESETKRMNALGEKILSYKETPSERAEYTRLVEKEGWTINIQEQFEGTAFEGMNVDEKALSEKGTTITSKEDLKAAIDRTLSREKNEAERQKLTDRIWDRMQKEDSGTSLPRKEGMESFYGAEGTKGIVGGVAEKLFGQKVGEVKINYSNTEVAKSKLDEFIAKMKAKYNFPENGRYSVLIKKNGTEQEIKTYIDLQQDYQNAEKTQSELGKPSTQPSIDITPALRAEVERGLALFQRQQGQQAKGAMVTADGRFIIYAITDPNVSTPLHELAHVFEHYLTNAERAAVQLWAGTKAWTTKTSEAFARGFEKYISEGKAPTPALQKIFDKFKTWLTDIYNGITGSDIDIELNEPMREIYAKMLGIEQPLKATPQAGSVVGGDIENTEFGERKIKPKKVISTKDLKEGDNDFGNAAQVSDDGSIIVYHVTNNDNLVNSLTAGKNPKDTYNTDGSKREELGSGVYGSAVPEYWANRSANKYGFLKDLPKEKQKSLANKIKDTLNQYISKGYITPTEYEYGVKSVREYEKSGNENQLLSVSGQPYNIRFWENEYLKDLGIENKGIPNVVAIKAKGNFVEFTDAPYLTKTDVDKLIASGIDGAFVGGGFVNNPELVIFNKDAIQGYRVDKLKEIDFQNKNFKAVEQSLQATSQAEFDNSEQGDVKFLAGGKSNLSEADEVQEVSEIIEKAAKEGNLISVDINEDVPKTNIPIVRSEKRPEGKLMNALRIGLDFIKDSRIGIGMSDWLRTGDREVTELGVDGKPQKKTIRDEGGIGYPFKSLMDLINGVQTDVNKIFGWAGVDEGAGTRMINAAKSAKKITGKELKSHYYKSLPNLTPKEKARIEKAIPNNKEYGVVGIFKMGASGLHSNEAFSSEALRQIETKLNETEKEIFFIAVEERLNSLEWKGKDKYLEMFNKANNFAELDAILKDPKLSLDVKSSIMNKIILSTSETESKEGTLAKLLKDYDITLESITDVTKEPQMDNMGENELTILVAIDPTQREPFNDKKRVRHNNYPYAVRGFPIGVLTEGMSLINLSPNLMGKYIKQSTLVVDDNASRTVDGKVEQKRIGLYQGADGLWYAEEGKGTTKKDVIEDGSTQSKYGENKSPLIFGNTKEDLIAKLEGKGYEISESAKTEAYAPQAPFLGGQTMTTLAATEIFSKPQFTPQEKLVKFLQKAFPNIVVEMTQKGFDAVQNNLIERKLLTKNGKAYGFIKDGKIYLDPSKLNNNTPIHEFGHIWSAVAKVSTPKVYQKGLSLVAGTKYEQSVLQSPEYQKIIKTLFGSDAIKKIGGKFIINENLPSEKLAELKEYIGDEALNKAIGDRGELFVNEAQRTNFKNWLDLLYTAIKNIMGISRRKASEIQKMNLNQFLDAVIADLLGGQKLSNVSSEKLSKEGDKMRFSAKETGNQSFQSNYGKGSRDLQEAERKLKEAWGKYLSNGISFDGMAEAEKERQLIVALLGYLKAKGIDIAKGIGNEVREFIKNKFGGVTDEMIDVAQGRMLTDYQKLYDIHMTPKNKEILDDMVSQVKSGEMSFEDFVNTIDNIVPNERIKNVFISYVNEQIDPLDGYVAVDEEIEELPESPKTEISKEEERAFIGGLLARPINSKNFPNIVGGNKTDDDVLKRITAVTQEDVQDRKVMVDTSYVRVALEDIKEIALQNANALYMQFGEDWQTKVMDYLSDYLNAANPAQAIGILNVISTDVQQKIEKSQSPTERTKLFKLQDKADELSILFASQASLGINARKILRQFAQGGNMSKLVLDKILTEDTMETIEEINRIAASKPTNEELNNATLPVQTPQTPKSRIQKIKANVKAALSSKQKKKPKITEQEIKELGQRAEEERKRQGIQTKMSRQQIAQMLKDEAKKC